MKIRVSHNKNTTHICFLFKVKRFLKNIGSPYIILWVTCIEVAPHMSFCRGGVDDHRGDYRCWRRIPHMSRYSIRPNEGFWHNKKQFTDFAQTPPQKAGLLLRVVHNPLGFPPILLYFRAIVNCSLLILGHGYWEMKFPFLSVARSLFSFLLSQCGMSKTCFLSDVGCYSRY